MLSKSDLRNDRATDPPDLNALIPLADVPALAEMPRRAGHKKLDVRSIRRWASRGFAGVKLQTVLVGGIRCTSRAWVRDFIERRSQADSRPDKPTTAEVQRAHVQASKELDRIGI